MIGQAFSHSDIGLRFSRSWLWLNFPAETHYKPTFKWMGGLAFSLPHLIWLLCQQASSITYFNWKPGWTFPCHFLFTFKKIINAWFSFLGNLRYYWNRQKLHTPLSLKQMKWSYLKQSSWVYPDTHMTSSSHCNVNPVHPFDHGAGLNPAALCAHSLPHASCHSAHLEALSLLFTAFPPSIHL